MRCKPGNAHSRLCSIVCAGLALLIGVQPTITRADSVSSKTAEPLIAAAVRAEVAGDSAKYVSLLEEAAKASPDKDLVHWQLGQIQRNGKWISVADVQREAASNPLEAEYLKRRASTANNVADQLGLARWCRDNRLVDEARLHWNVVLALEPTSKEAQHATDMMLKNGQLIARDDLAEQKKRAQEAKQAAQHWEPMVAKWLKAVSGRDIQEHDKALAEIRQVREIGAIPSFEKVTLGRDAFDAKLAEPCVQITLAYLEALHELPYQPATESVVRHAVLAPGNKARTAAVDQLKIRKQANFMPMLLSNLRMPVESSFSVETTPDGSVHYAHSLYREGPNADQSFDSNYFTNQYIFDGKDYQVDRSTGKLQDVSEQRRKESARHVALTATLSRAKYTRTAGEIEANVAAENDAAQRRADRIIPVLSSVTGQDFATAKQWWSYWQDTNEYYVSEHPVDYQYYSNTDDHYYGHPEDAVTRQHSCFGKGTPVWTKTGLKQIETLQVGDLVLAQNTETGELRFEPVLVRTLRPSGKMMKLTTDSCELNATTGHPFWVTGQGWKMTKELGDDAVLHCLKGADRVRSIAATDDAEAYNLVVAEFNTYFVGSSGLLVHDIRPRGPTTTIEPGIASLSDLHGDELQLTAR